MSLIPAPLTPPDCNLADFGYMPLDVRRLRDSRISASVTGEEFRAAVLLWCASWHQTPAASLPDDDVELATLAGYGRVIKEWLAVRGGALHGWVKCSDGRLYHPVVAEKAVIALNQRTEFAWRKECDRVRKENKKHTDKNEPLEPLPEKPPLVIGGIPAECRRNSSGKSEFSDGKQENSDGKSENSNGNGAVSVGRPSEFQKRSAGNGDNSDGIPAENPLKGTEGNREGDSINPPIVLPNDAPQKTRRPRRTACQIPADWTPTEEGVAYAKAHGAPFGADAIEAFRDYYTAHGKPMADWDAAWRTWCRNAQRFGRNGHGLFDAAPAGEGDPWGVKGWLAKQPDVEDGVIDGEPRKTINGWAMDHYAERIAEAAGLPPSWRGSWDSVGKMLREDMGMIDEKPVLEAVRSFAQKVSGPISSIAMFEGVIRGAAAKCLGHRR